MRAEDGFSMYIVVMCDDGPADARRGAVRRRPPVLDRGQRRRARRARAAGRGGRRAGRGPPHEPPAAGRQQVHHHVCRGPADRQLVVRADERGIRRQQRLLQLPDVGPVTTGCTGTIYGAPCSSAASSRSAPRAGSRSASSSASSPRPARTRSRCRASSARTSSRRRTTTPSAAASGPTASSSSATTARSPAASSSGRARRTRSATRAPCSATPSRSCSARRTCSTRRRCSTPRRATTTAACSPARTPRTAARTAAGACYNASTRTLTLGNNDSVTLGGAVYNFCQINLGNNSSINIATGAKVLIYLDSPGRSRLGLCPPARAACRPATARRSRTPPRTRGAADRHLRPGTVVADDRAPEQHHPVRRDLRAEHRASSSRTTATVVGGITAQSIEFKNNAFTVGRRASTNIHFATTLVYYRGAWRQCNSRVASTTAPATGCL